MFKEILDREEIKLVGVEGHFTETNSHELPALWQQFMLRLGEIKSATGKVVYGLCEAHPGSKNTEEFSYTACIEVSDFEGMPHGMIAKTAPQSSYAVFTHRGLIEDVGETLKYIYGTWLPSSEYERGEHLELQVFDERFKPGSDDSEVDIYVPVKIKN